MSGGHGGADVETAVKTGFLISTPAASGEPLARLCALPRSLLAVTLAVLSANPIPGQPLVLALSDWPGCRGRASAKATAAAPPARRC